MAVFESPSFANHEEVVFCRDPETGLHAIIAIHDTTLGPSLGGVRMWPYASESEAVEDVLRLSRGMTYKAAMAGLALGGGKSVIIGDPRNDKSEALFLSFGRLVDRLGGRYIAAEDVGTSVEDLEIVHRATPHAAGLPGGSGDPSGATAFGVYQGILAAVKHKLGRDSLDGVTVAVQGLGHVGFRLCKHLVGAGAKLIVTDINPEAIGRAKALYRADAVEPGAIFDTEAEVFAPCALGAVINDDTLARLKAVIVAGSANNQLAEDRHGAALNERGILYAPDYVINAGGLINISYEFTGYDSNRAFDHIGQIYAALSSIFVAASRDRTPTNATADRLAEERITRAKLDKAAPEEPSALPIAQVG